MTTKFSVFLTIEVEDVPDEMNMVITGEGTSTSPYLQVPAQRPATTNEVAAWLGRTLGETLFFATGTPAVRVSNLSIDREPE